MIYIFNAIHNFYLGVNVPFPLISRFVQQINNILTKKTTLNEKLSFLMVFGNTGRFKKKNILQVTLTRTKINVMKSNIKNVINLECY